MQVRFLLGGTLLAVLLTLSGCSAEPEDISCEVPETDIRLPADEAPHRVASEWWYYTGHLWNEDGKRYGFEVSFFQIYFGAQPGYAGHFALSDPETGNHVYEQNVVAPPEGFDKLDIDIGEWNIKSNGDTHLLSTSMENIALDIECTATKPPSFHGDRGLIEMGGGKLSYYYSLARMQVSGTLVIDGTAQTVTGTAWHDHQWGDFDVFLSNGWDWFSLQLDDNTEIMLFFLHFKDGGTEMTGGTFIDEQGCQFAISQYDLQSLRTWQSPHTDAIYPLDWTLSLPEQDIELSINATFDDQELDCRQTTFNVYWEGEVTVSGTRKGQAVQGLGFVELAGYGPWGPE